MFERRRNSDNHILSVKDIFRRTTQGWNVERRHGATGRQQAGTGRQQAGNKIAWELIINRFEGTCFVLR